MTQTDLELLPIRFDPQHFADHTTELHGLVAAKTMSRLQANVLSFESMVHVNLQFSPGLYGYPLAQGQAHAKVFLRCERCLDQMELNLEPMINVLIKPDSESLPEDNEKFDDEGPEFHEYNGKSLTLSDLIEEELLLALPLVPRHEDISLCNQDMVAWLASSEASKSGQGEDTAEKADNPFAILKR